MADGRPSLLPRLPQPPAVIPLHMQMMKDYK